jgi:hypothetical protein
MRAMERKKLISMRFQPWAEIMANVISTSPFALKYLTTGQ